MSTLWPQRPSYITGAPSRDFQEKKLRNVAILGSTGSIGRNALDVVEQSPDCLRILALSCKGNIDKLAKQAIRHRPPLLAVYDEGAAQKLKNILPVDYAPEIMTGPAGYAAIAAHAEIDCVLSAQVGAAGLAGTLAAALAGKVIALANKESLVLAGNLLRKICVSSGAAILPVDSEHNAIFQCLVGRGEAVANLILTASGGPFRGRDIDFLRTVSPAQALKHPNWSMGAKITIDSATMMNKGLEIIEAARLYGFSAKNIRVLVHPQSIVHSLVEFRDNSMLAQLAVPDMRLPIGACLLWPHCRKSFVKPLNLAEIGALTFENVDETVFKSISLARRALAHEEPNPWQAWGLSPACIVLNGANEMAVELFLSGQCGFYEIGKIVETALEELVFGNSPIAPPLPTLGQDNAQNALKLAKGIVELDKKARSLAADIADRMKGMA